MACCYETGKSESSLEQLQDIYVPSTLVLLAGTEFM